MPRLFSVLALAAAFLPAVFSNETDCNLSRVQLLTHPDRQLLSSVNTDYEVTRYDAPISSPSSTVIFEVAQNSASGASFAVSLNGERVGDIGNVNSPSVVVNGFNTECGADNLVLFEVTEVKDQEKRHDSCRFKYEIRYNNVC